MRHTQIAVSEELMNDIQEAKRGGELDEVLLRKMLNQYDPEKEQEEVDKCNDAKAAECNHESGNETGLTERCPVCLTSFSGSNPSQQVAAHVSDKTDDAHDVELDEDLNIIEKYTCPVEGCDRTADSRETIRRHYHRMKVEDEAHGAMPMALFIAELYQINPVTSTSTDW